MSETLSTVMSVCRWMNREPTPDLCVTVWNRVAHRYKAATGIDPERPLQPKTQGGGTHCMASYPEWFVPQIMEEIEAYGAEAAKQGAFELEGAQP
jgi:hypothetical protein